VPQLGLGGLALPPALEAERRIGEPPRGGALADLLTTFSASRTVSGASWAAYCRQNSATSSGA
jgi:hypothetical protein